MAIEFLDKNGFTYFWSKLKAKLSNKQDSLISGTNIKTINNNSLLGSGDISVQTPLTFDTEPTANSTNPVTSDGIKTYVDDSIPTQATESVTGTVKLNPSESVSLNSDGQLDVGGRLGQFGAAGIFHAKDRNPRNVGEYSLLITDALGMDMQAGRSFAVASGIGITGVISGRHPAGCTEYYIQNTYANRLMCAGLTYMSIDEATSKVQRIVAVESITINGIALTPDSSANDNNNPIVIKTAESLNPDSALTATSIRGFRSMVGYASAYIGSAVGADTGGAQLILGQGCFSKSGNMNVMLGQYHYNQGNGNTLLGRQHISKKNRWLLAGTGHDNTNGQNEAGAAVGQYSLINSNTLFAVGNGTSHTERKNAFEVVADGIVLLSPNGKRWKVAVNNSGSLVTSAL